MSAPHSSSLSASSAPARLRPGGWPLLARAAVAAAALGMLFVGVLVQPVGVLALMAAGGLGLIGLLIAWHYPELGIAGLVFLGSRILDPQLIEIRLPIGGGLELPDLALTVLAGMAILRLLRHRELRLPTSPAAVILLAFLWLAVFSAAYALLVRGVEPSWALTELRGLGYYSVFFLVTLEIRRPDLLWRLLGGLFVVGLATVVIMLIQQFVGPVPLLAGQDSTSWQIIGADDGGLTRIRPPGHVLLYFLSIAAAVLGIMARRRGLKAALLAIAVLINLALLLTFTRSQWVASALALVVCLALLPGRTRAAVLAACLALLLAVVIIFVTQRERWAEFAGEVNFATPLVARMESVFELNETLNSYSARTRLFQTEAALDAVRDEPWLGVGLGNAYRGLTPEEARTRYTRFVRFIENSYLYLATKMGIPSVVLFGALALALLSSGLRTYWRAQAPLLKALSLACLASLIGILVWGFLHPLLMLPEYTVMIGLIAGIGEAIGPLTETEENLYESAV